MYGVRALALTDRLTRASMLPGAAVSDTLKVISGQEMTGTMVRTWALCCAELAPPRLPGGRLVDTESMTASVLQSLRDGSAGMDVHPDEPWMRQFAASYDAARHRDGETLYASMAAVAELGERAAAQYVASFGLSAIETLDQVSAARPMVALLHLLGANALISRTFSVAGPAFRLTRAVMECVSTDGALVDLQVTPEFKACAELSEVHQAAMLAFLTRVLAPIMPPVESTRWEMLSFDNGMPVVEAAPAQDRSIRLALRIVQDVQSDRTPPYPGSEVVPAIYGACNLLAMRVLQLWDASALSDRDKYGRG